MAVGHATGGRTADRISAQEHRTADVERRGHCGDEEADDHEPQREPRQLLTHAVQRPRHHHWPDQVELLLHRERPEVQQRRRVGRAELGAEVVAELDGEAPVDDEEADGDGVVAERLLRQGRQQPVRGDEGDHRDERGGGQKAASAPGPEGSQRDGARAMELFQQQAGDEEPGQHEEHVDADEAAGELSQPEVEQEHQHHGDGPQAFHVGAKVLDDHVVERALEVLLTQLANPARIRRCGRSPDPSPA